MLLAICFEQLGNLRHQRIVRVGFVEQGADGEEDFADRQSGGPVVFENIEANAALCVDVAAGGEATGIKSAEGVSCRCMAG